jgi:hypothetical protein
LPSVPLATSARSLAVFEQAWQALAGADAKKAYRAVWDLVARGDETVRWLAVSRKRCSKAARSAPRQTRILGPDSALVCPSLSETCTTRTDISCGELYLSSMATAAASASQKK